MTFREFVALKGVTGLFGFYENWGANSIYQRPGLTRLKVRVELEKWGVNLNELNATGAKPPATIHFLRF